MKPTINLREYVHNEVLSEILQGNYSKDLPITEKQLIEKYEVSKSPIRDALIELCSEGILKALPRYGYMIVPYTQADITNISNFRLYAEPHYMDFYWAKFTPDRVRELEALAKKHEITSLDCDPVEHWQMNSEFHLALAKVCQDEFYYQTLKRTMQNHIVAFSQFYWDYWNKESIHLFPAHHKDILEHIKNGEKDKALESLREDISTFRIPG